MASSPADSGDSPPVFLNPESLNARTTRGSNPVNRPPADFQPEVLRRPIDAPPSPELPAPLFDTGPFLRLPMDPPMGYTGPSGVLPTEEQQSSHFVPIEDRWRIGYPDWDRYGKGHPIIDDYPYHARTLVRPV